MDFMDQKHFCQFTVVSANGEEDIMFITLKILEPLSYLQLLRLKVTSGEMLTYTLETDRSFTASSDVKLV